MSGKFANRLKSMQKQWSKNREGFQDVPPGEYSAQLQSAELKETQAGGLRVAVSYLITDGEQSGEIVWDGFGLDNEKPGGMKFFAAWLDTLGYDVPEELAEIEDLLAKIAGDNPVVGIRVVKNGDFTNVRLTEVLGSGDSGEAEDEAEAEEAPAEEDGESGGDDEAPADEDSGDDDDDRAALLAVATSVKAEVTDESDLEDIVKELKTFDWKEGDLTPAERELFDKHEIEYAKAKPAPAKKPAPAPVKKAAPAPAKKAAAKPVAKRKK